MLEGFKEFVMRGNVVDMAVGVIIGGAFGKIVAGWGTLFPNFLNSYSPYLATAVRKIGNNVPYPPYPPTVDMFEIDRHQLRDVAVLKFKSSEMAKLIRDIKPIPISKQEVKIGSGVFALGYPHIPGQLPALAMCD